MTYYDDKKPEPDPFQDFLDSEVKPFGILRNSTFSVLDNAATLRYTNLPADVAVTEALSFEPFQVGGYDAAIDSVDNVAVTESNEAAIALLHEGNNAATAFLHQVNDADGAWAFRNAGPNIAETSAYGRYVTVETVLV